jgi:hypothetical protein
MAERTNIPASPACGQWETLLADALDGTLRPEDEATFSSHMAGCAACTALFEEARRGREWLDFLSAEPELPEGLLERILAQTGPGQAAGYGLVTEGVPAAIAGVPLAVVKPKWQNPGFMGFVRRFAEPRLMMTAAMAFFSLALTLNLSGVKLTRVRLADLKPTSIRSFMERRITMASTPIIRYYDHLRLVYEVQARVRELKRTSEAEQPQPSAPSGQSKQNDSNHKDGGSRVSPPQQSVTPAVIDTDLLETSLILHDKPSHSGGSAKEEGEGSTVWIA